MERDLVICVEEVKRKRGLGPAEGGGVPSHPQQLTVVFNPIRVLCTSTELDINVVRAVGIDDEDLFENGFWRWTRYVLVADVERTA